MTDSIINIAVDEAVALAATGALLLDVREDDEWASGHAPEAVHIRLSELPDRFVELPQNVVVVCICHLGGRSARATAFLLEQGFEALNLDGGMVAWEIAGQPILY